MTATINALDALAADLAERGLRPVVDPELELVRCDCPDCDAGARDPLGLWGPLKVVPRGGRLWYACEACGATAVSDV